ncbi:hypothetical protein FB567DRAFT_610001 [Paraphoma chrysanthemicola]|uniref:3-carboxy-cis,cis-mucoante lactonizing enzyme n=1 Tax=Paraphoma chrysanthemicola TaxID=798071 RepID=A0A8K0RFD4_9PLEO|nr:hypothetical protein FB567DRAFT_610001 [Paraphoma chrysanthemicola]
MMRFLLSTLFIASSWATLHHLIAGTNNGQALYSLELDDQARLVYWIQARDAAGTSPSLALDRVKKHVFSSRPAQGAITRYAIQSNYELVDEGTLELEHSCNTTMFKSLQLTSASQNYGIWGSASTGDCSVVFGLTTDGYTQLRSKEIPGDVHSLAWGPKGHNIHALNSRASSSTTTSIVNFRISDDPNLEDIINTDLLANVADASQIVAHPSSNRIYVVTRGTNELITMIVQQNGTSIKLSSAPLRFKILPSSLDASHFHTSSLAISASGKTLWTLSQSSNQAVIVAFTLDPTTGDVIDAAARASWGGAGEGQLTAAPFEGGDIVAITNSPLGYITLLGLEQASAMAAHGIEYKRGHEYLQQLDVEAEMGSSNAAAPARIKSYGRTILDDVISIGESIWLD